MATHVVQSPEWGNVKTKYGTKAVTGGGVQYTKHKIPLTDLYYAYCPKVDPFQINFDEVKKSLKKEGCIAINFDVPNVQKDATEARKATDFFEKDCIPSPRDTFAKHNITLDLRPTEEELLKNMHSKHRYNVRYAQRKGVWVHKNNPNDFDTFYKLLEETAERQKYYIHPKKYYKLIWEILKPKSMCHIITAKYQNEALASWMLFSHENILYYPYGGSSEKHKNLFASNLLGWEAIKLGKRLGCHTFDMWGASENPNDKTNPWWGFTNFKLKFGGTHVTYIDSYDLVINQPVYTLFNIANNIRWKILKKGASS